MLKLSDHIGDTLEQEGSSIVNEGDKEGDLYVGKLRVVPRYELCRPATPDVLYRPVFLIGS